MLLTITIIIGIIGVCFALYGVYRQSEQVAAEPVEAPTPQEVQEGNLSAKIPVADDMSKPSDH